MKINLENQRFHCADEDFSAARGAPTQETTGRFPRQHLTHNKARDTGGSAAFSGQKPCRRSKISIRSSTLTVPDNHFVLNSQMAFMTNEINDLD